VRRMPIFFRPDKPRDATGKLLIVSQPVADLLISGSQVRALGAHHPVLRKTARFRHDAE